MSKTVLEPKPRIVSRDFIEIEGVEYEVRLKPERDSEINAHSSSAHNKMIIGYLIRDEDCQNPLDDCDGMGKIYSLNHRHINHIDIDEAREKLKSNPYAVALSYFEHGQCRWGVSGTMSSMPDFNWDGVSFAGVWEPDSSCLEHIELSAKTKAARIKEAIKCAEQACEQFTSWSNGDCWGVIVVTCEADGSMIDSDECWGYVGSEYAEQTMHEQMDAIAKQFSGQG